MLSFYLSMLETEEEKAIITEIYNNCEQKMYNVAYGILHNKYDAEDAVHCAFVRIINNIHRFTFESTPKTTALMVVISRNEAIRLYNARKKSPLLLLDDESSDGFFPPIEDSYFSDFDSGLLKEKINELPELLRDTVYLFYARELPAKEIASICGISENAVYKRLDRAKKLLYDAIGKENVCL